MSDFCPMADNGFQGRERLSVREKEAGGKAWYREWADRLDRGRAGACGPGGVPEHRRMRANYGLFNNVLDLSDFEYVCRPFGRGAGRAPGEEYSIRNTAIQEEVEQGLQQGLRQGVQQERAGEGCRGFPTDSWNKNSCCPAPLSTIHKLVHGHL